MRFEAGDSGIDKDADGDWHFALVDEIVEYDRGTRSDPFRLRTLLRPGRPLPPLASPIILGGDVNPVVMRRARINSAGGPRVFGDLAGWDSGLPHRIRTVRIFFAAEERRERKRQKSTTEHSLYNIAAKPRRKMGVVFGAEGRRWRGSQGSACDPFPKNTCPMDSSAGPSTRSLFLAIERIA